MSESKPSSSALDLFLQRTKNSRSILGRSKRVLPSGSTRAPFFGNPYAFYAKRAKGCSIWDVDGNRYIDFVNNMGPLILGHRHPAVEKALAEQVGTFWCGAPTELEVKLAETIIKAFPFGEKVAFTASGTEAMMKLVRAARAHTGKKKLILATGAYHGTSDSLLEGHGIAPELTRLVSRYRYNDAESVEEAIKQSKNEAAAVVIEAVHGPAGSVPPTEDFLKTAREETERRGIPLILDEVVTGFRVARGGISEVYSIRPDAVALGKIIGGGLPAGAFLGSEELMGEFSRPEARFPFIRKGRLSQQGTFNAHPLSMAAGLATLEQLTPDAYRKLDNLGRRIRDILRNLCEEKGIKSSVVGIGSIFMLHFSSVEVKDFETASSSDEYLGRLFDFLMLVRGVSLPRFHSAFASTPMGEKELKEVGEAANAALSSLAVENKANQRD